MMQLSALLSGLTAGASQRGFTPVSAPGGGDAGDLLWVAAVEHEHEDTAEQPGGAGPGRLPQRASATLRVDAVFEANNIAAADGRHRAVCEIISTVLAAEWHAGRLARWRFGAATLDPDRGGAARFSAQVEFTVFER